MSFTNAPKDPSRRLERKSDSCLAHKLGALSSLTSEEISLLEELEHHSRPIEKNDIIHRPGAALDTLFILKKGWVISEQVNEGKDRPIVGYHLSGDIIGFSELPFHNTTYQTRARSKGLMCPFPREKLTTLFEVSPHLSGLMFAAAMIEQAEMEDRATLYCRNHAVQKVALFILQSLDRLKLVNSDLHDQFQCPLTQRDIGNIVGLTNVHVSRTLRQLEEEGAIRRHRSFIRVTDMSRLVHLTGYQNRYATLDLSWLPQPRSARLS